jgi:hypothetical protein
MINAEQFLKDRSNLLKLKPSVEVLDFICKKITLNTDTAARIGFNPTAIAKEFYKNKYDELDNQFEIATERINRGTHEYKELEKTLIRKKKLGMQVISRHCVTLAKLGLICENTNLIMGYDKRNTYYYPTQVGSEVNDIINTKGFPLIDPTNKKSGQDTISDTESKQEIKYVQHSIKLRGIIRRILKDFPEVKKFGIYNTQNITSEIKYIGEQFNIEIEMPELYNDFFNKHISVDKRLLKKIAVFKNRSIEFWTNKEEIYEEMKLNLEKYFHQEISESVDIEPLNDRTLDWIYRGATFLARNKKGAFKEYFSDIKLITKVVHGDWLDQINDHESLPRFDMTEYSVGSYPIIRMSISEDENFKIHLEKKLGDYMKNLPQQRYYEDLIENIDLLQAMFALRAEIMTILKKESLKTHFRGKCKFIE